MTKTKQQRKEHQDKAFQELIEEISYKDEGELWRNNVHFRIICREEVI